MNMSTDSDWEMFGKSNPYFGVLTHEKYRSASLTKEAKDEFFETGSAHVSAVFKTIAEKLGRTGGFTRVLDFGCGVGRLLIPFSRLAREADAEKKRELETAQKESMRRNQALLATYTSERDIEDARTRALRDHQKQVTEVERRIEELQKRQARVEKELAVYNESGKGEPPTRLKEEITNADIDLRAQQGLLEVKKKEASSINARYDEDKRRYLELIGKKKDKGRS